MDRIGLVVYQTFYNSPLGEVLLQSDGEKLTVLKIHNHRFYSEYQNPNVIRNDNLEIFKKTKDWLDRYFKGEKPEIDELPLKPEGTKFRKRVWEILCKIPYGTVVTYSDIAKQIAREKGIVKMSAQAVGGAVGHNPIGIIIPCHRVVGKDGSLTGYSGGIQNKVKLLELEQVDMTKLYVPITDRRCNILRVKDNQIVIQGKVKEL